MIGLILATNIVTAKPTLDLVKTFAEQHRIRTCVYSIEIAGIPGKGAATWQCQDRSIAWKASYMSRNWSFFCDGAWSMTLDSTNRLYAMDEFNSGTPMPSEAVDDFIVLAYPTCLAERDPRRIENGLLRWEESGSTKLAGEQVRKVKGVYKSEARTREIVLLVAPSGEIRHSTERATGSGGTHLITLSFQPSTNAAPDKNMTSPHLPPAGFNAAAEKMASPALPGESIRLPQGLSLGNKAVLIYIPSPSGDPMREFIAAMKGKIPSGEVVLIELSVSSEKRWTTFGTARTTLADLHPAGTPSIFLIENTGEILDSWLGFALNRSAQLEKEILQAIKARKDNSTLSSLGTY